MKDRNPNRSVAGYAEKPGQIVEEKAWLQQTLLPPAPASGDPSAHLSSHSSNSVVNVALRKKPAPTTLHVEPRAQSPTTGQSSASDRSHVALARTRGLAPNASPAHTASGTARQRKGRGKRLLADTTARSVVEARSVPGGSTAPSSSTSRRLTDTFDLDKFIDELLSLRSKPVGTQMNFNVHHFPKLCAAARKCFASQPCHLELDAPVKVCGDIHGQYFDLLRVFHHGGYPPDANYLFLGDYVDRGQQSLETISLLLAYKVKFPENFFLLRGNHETANISRIYGFFDECKRRYNPKLWQIFIDVFKVLPFTARISDRILCMHGGISPELHTIAQLPHFQRPCEIPDSGLLCDILWSDPLPHSRGWLPNDRGVSFTFGADVLQSFCKNNDIDLLCRAHQVVEDGFEFFAKRRLVTVFSAPNYCQEFNNAAAFLDISATLECNFVVWKAYGFKGLGYIKEKYSGWSKMKRF